MIKYFKFLVNQLKGWQTPNYSLFFFSLGVQLMIMLNAPITWLSVLTFIGTTLGVLCVVAINAAKSVNGVLGILSAICFIIIGFKAKNYLSIGEQIAYMATLDIPVLLNRNWNVDMESHIRKFKADDLVMAIFATVAVWLLSAWIIGSVTNDPRPWIDGLSFAIALTAGIICTMRFSDQYFWWLASGLVQVALWFVTLKQGDASAGMLVNSLIYVMNDVIAFCISPWFNKRVRNKRITENEK